ncbi:type II toxin-antitoxin system RelE/ParE family toxin [Prosthecobacter sp.]|uniref:type II toxin-antitoxin system RelE/ParE family toxin n=1 Tax=Prosthecobacter sp. TaxID=1965333 RepID=UPI002ABBF49F|nr:type II toxin-antitoxin system RelE/ParE family toxin [Prosthecobacter sp.]MDZ4402190.1 type II toxin-antitoxin system RelE/ParE family toxin [Prosthecobacter sp.]
MAEAIISPEALQDMADIHHYIAMDNPVAADRVVQAFEENAALLAAQPDLGQHKPRLRDLRLWVITEFPNYLMFYRQREGQIEIVRVLHGAQDLQTILE